MQLLLAVHSQGRALDPAGKWAGRGLGILEGVQFPVLPFHSFSSCPVSFSLSFCSFSFRYADPVCSKERRHAV